MVYIDPSLPSIRADIRAKPIIVFQIDVDVIHLKWSLFMLILELKMVENFKPSNPSHSHMSCVCNLFTICVCIVCTIYAYYVSIILLSCY